MGFEPTRAEHNGLAVHRLNHSATSSRVALLFTHLPFIEFLNCQKSDTEKRAVVHLVPSYSTPHTLSITFNVQG